MTKLLVELYFEQRSTGSGGEFRDFFRELLENSNDLNPEPTDINALYGRKLDEEDALAQYPYNVLILTYEIGDESVFRMKKRILESIKLVENKMSGASFDSIKTKTE
ncbi:MAG TPA: hypothetical protein VGE31_02105 [Candidatus Paceibacterota bacterium]